MCDIISKIFNIAFWSVWKRCFSPVLLKVFSRNTCSDELDLSFNFEVWQDINTVPFLCCCFSFCSDVFSGYCFKGCSCKTRVYDYRRYQSLTWRCFLNGLFLVTSIMNQYIFFYQGFLHRRWQFTGQQGKGGDHLLFHCTTSTRSRTLTHLFATLHVRWLSRIFNRNVCVYQTGTRWDLSNYRITIWVIDWWCNVCLFTWLIDTRFLLQRFDTETGGFELASTITLVLQANRLTKCAYLFLYMKSVACHVYDTFLKIP